ncbi:MAG TPA: DUF3810 domain-containing protein [Bacillota bacterium]|nr:DUF3810 domain-containing protein [Bacillota bacterium]
MNSEININDNLSADTRKQTPEKEKKLFSPYFSASAVIACLAAAVFTISYNSVAFAEWYARTAGQAIRSFIGTLTGWIPFSLAECMLLSIIPIAVFYMIRSSQAIKHLSSNRVFWRWLLPLVAIIFNMLSLYSLAFGTSNYRASLADNLDLDRKNVSADELYETYQSVNVQLNALLDEINFEEQGASEMPYSFYELSTMLNDAYDEYCGSHDYISTFYAMPKAVALSEPMTYTHISGVYSFFTGEANVNTNYPDYVIPYTMAHEMAHQRGIAREDEANFVAFLVCMESDDDYIKYSALLSMQEYLLSALGKASKEQYSTAYYSLDLRVRYEMRSYSKFFDKYRSSTAATVTNAVNNTFLQVQGQTEGTKSYGMVVDLAVAYYKTLNQ